MSFIQQMTDSYIPDGKGIIKYDENHILMITNVATFLHMPIVNWKRNRPPDIERCKEIAKDICKNKPMLDSMFYLHFVDNTVDMSGNKTNARFECLDGIHRYTAIAMLHTEYTRPPDLLEFDDLSSASCSGGLGGGGNMDWLYRRSVLLNIRSNCSEEILSEIFRNINNCVPVPITYLEEYDERKRKCAETIAFDWQRRYRTHFVVEKTAQFKPHRPNTTNNRFVNFVSELYESLRDREAVDEDLTATIETLLVNANAYIQNHLVLGIPLAMLEKCRKTGCYLFLYKYPEVLQIIARLREGMIIV
jgi:hypothetical protein